MDWFIFETKRWGHKWVMMYTPIRERCLSDYAILSTIGWSSGPCWWIGSHTKLQSVHEDSQIGATNCTAFWIPGNMLPVLRCVTESLWIWRNTLYIFISIIWRHMIQCLPKFWTVFGDDPIKAVVLVTEIRLKLTVPFVNSSHESTDSSRDRTIWCSYYTPNRNRVTIIWRGIPKFVRDSSLFCINIPI